MATGERFGAAPFPVRRFVLLVWVFTLMIGCASVEPVVDYGRVGLYKVTLVDAELGEQQLVGGMGSFLETLGYEQFGDRDYYWSKGLSSVRFFRDAEFGLLLKFRAFGGINDVSLSEETERRVVNFLQRENINLTPLNAKVLVPRAPEIGRDVER